MLLSSPEHMFLRQCRIPCSSLLQPGSRGRGQTLAVKFHCWTWSHSPALQSSERVRNKDLSQRAVKAGTSPASEQLSPQAFATTVFWSCLFITLPVPPSSGESVLGWYTDQLLLEERHQVVLPELGQQALGLRCLGQRLLEELLGWEQTTAVLRSKASELMSL